MHYGSQLKHAHLIDCNCNCNEQGTFLHFNFNPKCSMLFIHYFNNIIPHVIPGFELIPTFNYYRFTSLYRR
ncbi:hypothetical protein ERO13_D05G197733v2 [Gossypium hirsutum]|uniref:Uncharacterized protein n=2 Tax=Gossypium TaxID=3633 RepID=A0A5D2UYX8_GOSMU|nr:hypothetical protein ERO13_D05G197733v2 [Gossypium hirsutum]TYH71856.1 hypothetical protein ES332_D05G213700v1 [Gossypium tomentosum]TYI82251.1 hypothetical protein E1A91_D05G209400v1 [Gossypium mustelinum]